MPSIHNYGVYIFDCDGVILDSNRSKIEAMNSALCALSFDPKKICDCVEYFKFNFGKSRFHHVEFFLDEILAVGSDFRDRYKEMILDKYSLECRKLYSKADITHKFIDFVESLEGKKYVASGSEQSELRDVFIARGLDKYFDGIFGSPVFKSDLITNILDFENTTNAVMIGDAVSDLEAAELNNIQFIFYSPYSNVKEKMTRLCLFKKYPVISDYSRGLTI